MRNFVLLNHYVLKKKNTSHMQRHIVLCSIQIMNTFFDEIVNVRLKLDNCDEKPDCPSY